MTESTGNVALSPTFIPLGERLRRKPEFGAIIAFLVIFAFFSMVAPRFFSLRNLTSVFTIAAELGIMTIGASFLMICGEFDLSISGNYALAGFLFVMLGNAFAFPLGSVVALLIALAIPCLVGFVNAQITLRGQIPSFIATLGMMMFLRGILLGITGGASISYLGDAAVPSLLTGLLAFRFRPSHLWFICLIVVFAFILNRTVFGNRVFATGGKKEAARTLGVNVDRVKTISFVACSLLAAFSGVVAISRFRLANVAFGQGMELEAIAAAVIGGTLMAGGYGSVIGAALGAAIMGMVRTGLVLAGAPAYWYSAFVGVILIVAATMNLKLRRATLER
ncbi:MAG TPA: ABC transporter permease [Atribacteraceae bacterium]|nr:ABC transporter permease [Atribacteraceae bacterium]